MLDLADYLPKFALILKVKSKNTTCRMILKRNMKDFTQEKFQEQHIANSLQAINWLLAKPINGKLLFYSTVCCSSK